MSFTTYLIIFLFGYVSASDQKFRCDYTYFNDAEGYLKVHRVPANWYEARVRCHLEGAKLASPLNYGIQSSMRELMKRKIGLKYSVFTGIHSYFSRGDFHSVEGIRLSKIPHKWADGEPDNYNDSESCIMMLQSGQLADVNCSAPLPYLCYKKAAKRLPVSECGTTDPGYTFYKSTGSCYKFHSVPRTWSRAYMACTAEGGYLTIINSEAESEVIKEIFAKNPDHSILGNFEKGIALVGFQDWGEHGEFLTIESQTLTEAGFDKFAPGEPNTFLDGEYCGAITRSGLFNDIWCDKQFAFICEKSPYSLLCEDYGHEADGQEPDGQESDGQEPDGQESDGQEPDGQESDGQEPDGQEPDGQKSDGQELNSRSILSKILNT